MANPLVSVIVPTYNCAPFVRASLQSVLDQSYAPLEVIVVDDGSSDGTLDVLGTFGDRIRVFSQANRGPAAARNRALKEARGDYLAFLDGDDLWLPGHVQVLMDYFAQHADARVVFGQWLLWPANEDGSYSPMELPSAQANPPIDADHSGWLYSKLLFESLLHIIATIVHRSVYTAVDGFDESLRTGSDYDFWLKVSRKFPIVQLKTPVAVYRLNPSSVSYSVRTENNPYRLLRRAVDTYGLSDDAGHGAEPKLVQHRLADLAFVHGYRHFWRGNPGIAQRSFMQALAHRPWSPKTAAYVAAALFKRLTGLPPNSTGRD